MLDPHGLRRGVQPRRSPGHDWWRGTRLLCPSGNDEHSEPPSLFAVVADSVVEVWDDYQSARVREP
jgi:hypothetical protein